MIRLAAATQTADGDQKVKMWFANKPAFMKSRIFKYFASVRFAIPVLFLFAAGMAVGTVLESMYGTEFAKRTVYATPWFYLIQFSMGLSVLLAMLDRFPYKKRLTGFYTVHTALIIIMAGSVVTKLYGIDGTLEVQEESASDSVRLGDDLVYLRDGTTQIHVSLPVTVSPQVMNVTYPLGTTGTLVTALKYLPYAGESPTWVFSTGAWSSVWELKNSRATQEIRLSAGGPNGGAEQSSAEMGPLRVEVIPAEVFATLETGLKGMATEGRPAFALIDSRTQRTHLIPDSPQAYRIPGSSMSFSKASGKKAAITYYELKTPQGPPLQFFPHFSPKPVARHMEPDASSPYTLIELAHFTSSNTVLLSRAPSSPTSPAPIRVALVSKTGEWNFTQYGGSGGGEAITLPWMGFKLRLVEDHPDQRPEPGFAPTRPNKDDAKNVKALLVRVQKNGDSEVLWLTNRAGASSRAGLEEGFIGVSEMKIPFQMQLERFKMDLVPGTMNSPASYESFVRIHKGEGTPEGSAHIFMNNPLKTEGFTFYQASYLQDEAGKYHSILSVNRDPGRPIKYAGSLLLVVGLILHFLIIYGYTSLGTPSPTPAAGVIKT